MRVSLVLLATLMLSATTGMPAASVTERPSFSGILRHRLEAARSDTSTDNTAAPAVQALYAGRLYKPLWLENGRPRAAALGVTALLASARDEGLDPSDYQYARLHQALAGHGDDSPSDGLTELDLTLTRAVVRYATDMLRGRVRPERLFSSWESSPQEIDIVRYLERALEENRLVDALRDLAPRHEAYHRLRGLLGWYREIRRLGGLVAVPPGPALKPGMRSERIASLRRRLWQSGDLLPEHADEAGYFDPGLEAAVKRYQARHGLETDGIVGTATLESLSTPVSNLIQAIELNMERWRWLPRDLGERYINVNIAGFELNVVEDGNTVLSMPVVVGKRYHATPVFSGRMTYLVFNPYWNVPDSIAVDEILPALRSDPAYLEKQSMRVLPDWSRNAEPLDPAMVDWDRIDGGNFPYRFRQDPGTDNALGLVKFMFPNKYNVYLHDTPAKSLFARAARDFSHGCIRLSRPLDLAEYLLRDQAGWDAQRIREVVDDSAERVVPLARPWPVHLLYWTVWVGAGSEVHFRPDVYGRDERLAAALYN